LAWLVAKVGLLAFKELCGKLDALSSFAFAPKPVVEELEVSLNLGFCTA
jgi:hypothetical protein